MKIAIDLGTSFSLIGLIDSEGAHLLAEKNIPPLPLDKLSTHQKSFSEVKIHHYTTPSIVSLCPDNQVYIGNSANMIVNDPPDTLIFKQFKRHIGTSWTTQQSQNVTLPDNRILSATDLSALVLQQLLNRLPEKVQVSDIELLVLTVPAYFNLTQRQATERAAQIAGFKEITLISEPTAAVFACDSLDPDDEYIVVLDLGGGTFDVSIVEVIEGLFEVKAISGDTHLGGMDFQELIANYIRGHLTNETIPFSENDIQYWAMTAMHRLSKEEDIIFTVGDDQKSRTIQLNRCQFTEMASPLLLRIRHCIEQAMIDSGCSPSMCDKILMVGGAARLPVLSELVTQLFQRPAILSSTPDIDIVKGACRYAQSLAMNKQGHYTSDMLLDVLGQSLGMAVNSGSNYRDDIFKPIIDRTALLPIARKERFKATNRNSSVEVTILQGESRIAHENTEVMRFDVHLDQMGKQEDYFDIEIKADISGLIHVIAQTGKQKKITTKIESLNDEKLSEEALVAAKSRLKTLAIIPEEQTENAVLLKEAYDLYQFLSGPARDEFNNHILYFEQNINHAPPKQMPAIQQDFKILLKQIKSSIAPFDHIDEPIGDNEWTYPGLDLDFQKKLH